MLKKILLITPSIGRVIRERDNLRQELVAIRRNNSQPTISPQDHFANPDLAAEQLQRKDSTIAQLEEDLKQAENKICKLITPELADEDYQVFFK